MLRNLAVVPLVLMFGHLAVTASAETWSLSRDFQSLQNPKGPWAFGSVADRHASIDLYTDTAAIPAAYGTTQLAGWSSPSLGVAPYVLKNTSTTDWNYDGTALGGGPAVLKPGQVLLHPSSLADRYTVVRWTAPRAGRYIVDAIFTRFEQAQGFNCNYAVLLNGDDLAGASGTLTGYGNADSTAAYKSPELVLTAGEDVSFAVGYGSDGTHNTDGTTLHAVIRSVDGIGDLVVQNQTDLRVALLSLDGRVIASSITVQPTLPTNWRVAAAADFNGDGRKDILVQNIKTRAISILLVSGATVTASVPVNPTLPTGWSVMASSDIDGDGSTDIIVQNSTSQRVAALLMNGTKIVKSRSFSKLLAPGWTVSGSADMSGDGRPDLIVQNSTTRQISILTLNGLTITGSVSLNPTLPPNWYVGAVGDYDGDGVADLAVQNTVTRQISVLATQSLKITRSVPLTPVVPEGWMLAGPK